MYRRWSTWGISAQLVTVAVIPAFVAFLVVTFVVYASSIREVTADVQTRGRIMAAALADSSRYAVVSGNITELKLILRQAMASDQSVVGVAVLDSDEKVLTIAGDTTDSRATNTIAVSAPILINALNVDLFSSTDSLHVPSARSGLPRDTHVAGYAKVIVSPAILLAAKRQQIYSSIFFVLLATLASGAIGLALAQRVRRPVLAIVAALRDVRKGKYDIEFDSNMKGELGEIQKIVVEMASNLKTATQSLEEQVQRRTAQFEEAICRLEQSDTERRRLIAHGHEMVEEERRRIAVEIHDSLNAALISVRLWAADIASKAADGDSVAADIERSAGRILSTVDVLYASARSIVKQLRPETIDMLGLRGAIEEMVQHYDDVHPECRFELRADADFPKLGEQRAIAAFRLVQEALSNVVKHSKATKARVLLQRNTGSHGVRITIEDNGCGFDPRNKSSGIGLIGMRERVGSVGGQLTITHSGADRGAKLVIELPIDSVVEAPATT